jgi:hypothetical protein
MRRSAPYLVSCVLVCCGGAERTDDRRISQEIEAQMTIAKAATIPSGATLAESSGPTRKGPVVSAEWAFDTEKAWNVYRSEAADSLQRSGYEALSTTPDAFAFAKHIPGDTYRVRIEGKGSASVTRVTVSFSASPD